MALDLKATLVQLFERGSETPGVVSVYLFGSQAGGRAHRESDVDVGVLLDFAIYPDREHRFEARLRVSGEVGRALARNDVDLVVLNDTPPHLARAVVTKGLRLFCANKEIDHAFVRTTLLRAPDLDPFLRRARQVKLAAIRR